MNVASIKKYLKERGVTVNDYLKLALVTIAAAVEKIMLPLDPSYETNNKEKNVRQRLFIHDMQIADPFVIKTQNNFIDSPPFGLYHIFNHLIYHATEYDKQGLAAYKSYEDSRLLQITGDKSVTNDPCKWVRKPQRNTGPCRVEDQEILKGSLPSGKKRKREYNLLQNIDYDPRPTKHRKVHSFKAMKTFTNNLNVNVSPPPVILSLLKKHYLLTAGSKGFKKEPEVLERNCAIMKEKLEQFVKQTTMLTPR
ncbi:Hypothetical predicted protein [Paramuricea clavata]|uniref:Uncharacterized protein n=1 Tax=Paramuricea clavata TaxID=317549 RepID=A0A7D9IAU6_PARCT|nr:Hypothetical predicted protein [Paramuricea clavata]